MRSFMTTSTPSWTRSCQSWGRREQSLRHLQRVQRAVPVRLPGVDQPHLHHTLATMTSGTSMTTMASEYWPTPSVPLSHALT